MTNNEILQSDLLDILFEHRNKSYGAYALRRGYERRLTKALTILLAIILGFILINVLGNEASENLTPSLKPKEQVTIIPVEMPNDPVKKPDEPVQPPKPKPLPAPAAPLKTVKHFIPVIKPDPEVPETEMPDQSEIQESEVGDENKNGTPSTGIVTMPAPVAVTGTAVPEKPNPDFIPDERAPEFPGGPEALRRFLSGNLDTPGSLEAGEKKTVRIRFWVGRDGSISALEIDQTGGAVFDREVMRVCKKMPRWKPAVQNGVTVPVSYLLPVTFIGSEQ